MLIQKFRFGLDPTPYAIASYDNSSFTPAFSTTEASNQQFREACILLVFTMANQPVETEFRRVATAAAAMRREEDSSASLPHLITHILHRAVLMKMTYISPLHLNKSSQE